MRMTPETFNFIHNEVDALYQKRWSGQGEIPLCSKKSLAITIWYLSNKSSYREIAELFGISRGFPITIYYMAINSRNN